jgi:2-(1,2-epoxy-1,2-dihydrophenyl)acetyl-CoA isomerase
VSCDHLQQERHGDVAVITLNRPDRLNALTADLLDDLREALFVLAEVGDVRAIVVTGAGRAFSSGADRLAGPTAADALLREHYNPLAIAMLELRLPLVAAVNGVAAGAGASLALACDFRIAAASARFQLPFVRVGLVPDAGASWLLPRIVGAGRAAEMALLGRSVDAHEAREWGLVTRLSDDGRLLADALEVAAELATLSSSVAATKRALLRSCDAALEDQLEFEARLQGEAQQHPDYAEAREAFREKRQPRFAGR